MEYALEFISINQLAVGSFKIKSSWVNSGSREDGDGAI